MKFVFTFPVLLLLISCGSGTTPTSDNASATENPSTDSISTPDPVQAYTDFLLGLDSNDVTNMSKAAWKFKEMFRQSTPEAADNAYMQFDAFYNRTDSRLNDFHQKHLEEYDVYTYEDSVGNFHLPAKVKNYQDKLIANGFDIEEDGEGSTYIGKTRQKTFQWMEALLSPAMMQYIREVGKEETEWLAADAAIIVSEQEFVRRLIFWEDFVKNNPNFVAKKQAEDSYQNLLTWFLTGMDNTPVYWDEDAQVATIEPYFDKAYSYLGKKYPASETNKKIAPYFKLVKAHKRKEAEKLVQSYRKKGYIADYSYQ